MGKKKNKYIKWYKSCHEPVEIIKNLTLCSKYQVLDMLREGRKPDVFVPLDSLDGKIWEYLEPGEVEIFYYPVEDYGVLDQNHMEYLVNKIIKDIKDGKKVWLFCLGGHGRTGYVSACILGKMGIEDPIAYLWNHYCINAIESSKQIREIIDFLGDGFESLEFYYEQIIEQEFARLQQENDFFTQYYGATSTLYPVDEPKETAKEAASVFINPDYEGLIVE